MEQGRTKKNEKHSEFGGYTESSEIFEDQESMNN